MHVHSALVDLSPPETLVLNEMAFQLEEVQETRDPGLSWAKIMARLKKALRRLGGGRDSPGPLGPWAPGLAGSQ